MIVKINIATCERKRFERERPNRTRLHRLFKACVSLAWT